MRRILTALLVLAATLATPAIPVAALPQPDPAVPAGLHRCSADSEAYCGSVEVPLDRTGAHARLAVDRVPLLPAVRHQPAVAAHDRGA